jgi:hypothetical protein
MFHRDILELTAHTWNGMGNFNRIVCVEGTPLFLVVNLAYKSAASMQV